MTYEIHALPAKFFFQGNATLTTHSAIPLIKREMKKANITYAVFPDEGAKKRFEGMLKHDFKIITCVKEHVKGSTDKIVKLEDSTVRLNGHNAIIIDDMSKSGKTLFKCMDTLVANGAESVSMFITHCVFTDEFWPLFHDRIQIKGDAPQRLGKFYTTDSVANAEENILAKYEGNTEIPNKWFEFLSLAPRIIKDL